MSLDVDVDVGVDDVVDKVQVEGKMMVQKDGGAEKDRREKLGDERALHIDLVGMQYLGEVDVQVVYDELVHQAGKVPRELHNWHFYDDDDD